MSIPKEIAPNVRLTVHGTASLWWATNEELEAKIIEGFSNSIFPVDRVNFHSILAHFSFSGVTVESSIGENTTLPERNLTLVEFKNFIQNQLDRLPMIRPRIVEIETGDQTGKQDILPVTTQLKVGAIITATVIIIVGLVILIKT